MRLYAVCSLISTATLVFLASGCKSAGARSQVKDDTATTAMLLDPAVYTASHYLNAEAAAQGTVQIQVVSSDASASSVVVKISGMQQVVPCSGASGSMTCTLSPALRSIGLIQLGADTSSFIARDTNGNGIAEFDKAQAQGFLEPGIYTPYAYLSGFGAMANAPNVEIVGSDVASSTIILNVQGSGLAATCKGKASVGIQCPITSTNSVIALIELSADATSFITRDAGGRGIALFQLQPQLAVGK